MEEKHFVSTSEGKRAEVCKILALEKRFSFYCSIILVKIAFWPKLLCALLDKCMYHGPWQQIFAHFISPSALWSQALLFSRARIADLHFATLFYCMLELFNTIEIFAFPEE